MVNNLCILISAILCVGVILRAAQMELLSQIPGKPSDAPMGNDQAATSPAVDGRDDAPPAPAAQPGGWRSKRQLTSGAARGGWRR